MNRPWRVGGLLLALTVTGCADPNHALPSVPPIQGQGVSAKDEAVVKGKKPQATHLQMPN